MTKILSAGIAGLTLALALAANAAAAAPSVSLRVEGQHRTLMPRTAVTLLEQTEPNTGCAGNSGSAAIEIGTKGDWDRQPYFKTLLGETHDFSNSDYWALWVFRGGRYVVANGACDERLAEGEELLAAYQEAPPPDYAPRFFPMWIVGVPGKVKPGEEFVVSVYETQCEQYCAPGEGHAVARPGATVTAGGVTATTDAQGHARLTLSQGGEVAVRATRDGSTPSATETTCVTTGDDGLCGTVKPAPPCVHDGDDGRCGTRDRKAAEARIAGIREQQRFTRATAPRELKGTVAADASGIKAVKLRLTRRHRGKCEYFSGRKEKFLKTRCGRAFPFKIGESADWSYLLPSALKPGRYVFDVIAVDGAFNRDTLERGRSRVVFHVR